MYDIVIIGAGVIGGLIARDLARYDLDICIVEKENDVAMGATRANSAIVHAGFDAKEGTLKALLNVRGSEMMETTTAQLGVKYQRNGALVVAFADERREVEELYDRGRRNGVKGLRIVEQDELRKMEPNVADEVVCALWAPTSAIICPYELAIAAVGNAMDNGVDLMLNFEVTGIEKTGETYLVHSPETSVETRYVINCAGVYSDKIAHMTGDDNFKITPRRGEYLLLDKECGTLVHSTIFHTPNLMGKGILVTPTVDGNLLLGPTSENIEDKECNATTEKGLREVMKKTGENVKNIPLNKVITSFCGLRSVGDTGDFVIKQRDNIVTVAGIESPALSSSPAIAEFVTSLVLGTGIKVSLRPGYNPYRKPIHYFRNLSDRAKNQIIRKDPRYGHVICRCEGITEGEIVEAVRQNPPATDIDGVKRRTRAGMGRCQGGFCSPSVAEILSRERNIPFEDVTKFGKGSVLNFGKTKEGK